MIRTIVVCLLLVLAVLAVYWPTMGYGFIDFDDTEYLRDNPVMLYVGQYGLTGDALRWAFTTSWHSNWHPVTWLSWMIDAHLFGLSAARFHQVNVLIHIVNVLLLLAAWRAMTGQFWPSALVAGLFALHPVHVESVAWISERKDLLCGLFFMYTLLAYVRYVRSPGVWSYGLVLCCFGLGLMSKSMIVTIPGVLLLLDYWPLRRLGMADFGLRIGHDGSARAVNPQSEIRNPKSVSFLILEKLPLLFLGLIVSLATWHVQRPSGQLEEGLWIPMSQRLSNAALAYVRSLGHLVWPRDLAVLYPNPNLIGDVWPAWMLWGAAMVLAIITAMVWLGRRQCPWLVVGWLWFIGVMLPVIGLVQFGRQSMADRYTYLPFIGLYAAVAWELAAIIRRWPSMKFAVGPAMAAVLVALAVQSRAQVALWSASRVLFQHAVDVTDNNWVMHRNLAGELQRDELTNEAFDHMEEALRIFPHCAALHDHLGSMLALHGRLYEAQRQYELALEVDPDFAPAHFNLAVILKARRRYDEALQHLEQARLLSPDDAAKYDDQVREIRSLQSRSPSSTAPAD